MQKNLIIVLLVLVTVSINIAVTNFLIDRNSANLTTPKIVVVDKKKLLTELNAKGDKIQTVRDYHNIMTFLSASGFIVVKKQHVLSHGVQYDMPKINMPLVEVMLKKEGLALMTEQEAEDKLNNASNMIKKDFNF